MKHARGLYTWRKRTWISILSSRATILLLTCQKWTWTEWEIIITQQLYIVENDTGFWRSAQIVNENQIICVKKAKILN